MSANRTTSDPPTGYAASHDYLWRDVQRARLTETRRKIIAFQDELERLEKERQELENLLETFGYPVLTVPPELVSKIFLECLDPPGWASKRHAPLLLAQICRQWRDILLSTPGLWNSISLEFYQNYSDDYPDTSDSDCKLMRMWFHRAGATPLFIRLTCSDCCEAFPPNILSTIGEFSQRWGRLEMELPSRDLANHTRESHHLTQLPMYPDAPALRELHLFHWSDLAGLRLASPSLTTLEIGVAIPLDQWSATLRHFPNLQHLMATLKWQQASLMELQNLPPLETLIISTSTWGTTNPLPTLTLPHLRRLRHKLRLSDYCALEYLSLSIDSFDHDSLMTCVLAVPSLVTLKIDRQDSEPKFYEELQSPGVLPSLRELSISESGCYYSYDPIIAMLHARRAAHPNCARLRSFKLQLEVRHLSDGDELPLPNAAIVRRLERLAADDLRIRIAGEWVFWPEDAPGATFDYFYRDS
ncbi:hypothetical protein C8R43DRAFT_1190435 [Mycena crocata]|nr:hypothetical protein C8R43DRAFT_1190435 [Mycena crocata]